MIRSWPSQDSRRLPNRETFVSQVQDRVRRYSVLTHLEVQVVTRRVPRRTHPPNILTNRDLLPYTHKDAPVLKVRVPRG